MALTDVKPVVIGTIIKITVILVVVLQAIYIHVAMTLGFTFGEYGDKVQELLKNILIYNFIYVL